VSAALSSEPVLAAEPAPQRKERWVKQWWQPIAGAAVAAGVAAMSILWMRSQASLDTAHTVAKAPSPAVSTSVASGAASPISTGEPDSYVVPKTPGRRLVVPSTELANYVVAHSEFSSPVGRRNLLSSFMATPTGTTGASAGSEEPTEDVQDDAKNSQ
jgi:hypothetical protein